MEKTPFLIGVAGGTASGKSTVCKIIMEKLRQSGMNAKEKRVVCISQDSFYKELTPEQRKKVEKGEFNFDHPDAFDETFMEETLKSILDGNPCSVPVYDYKSNALCEGKKISIDSVDVVLFEGILVFYFPNVRKLFHMKLFVDTDLDTRLAERVTKDVMERERKLDVVLKHYMTYVKPAFEQFCLPTKKFADVIIPRGADNEVAINLIVQHIFDLLMEKTNGMESVAGRRVH